MSEVGRPEDNQSRPTVLRSRASRRPPSRSRVSSRPLGVTPEGYLAALDSLTELRAMQAFWADPRVADVIEQPPPVRYVDDNGIERTHTFDFLVSSTDGRKIAVLVKPPELADRRGTWRLRDLLAQQTPADVATHFVVLTGLDRDRIHNAKLVAAARRSAFPAHDARMRAAVERLTGPTSTRDLVATSELGAAGLSAVARLVGEGALVLVGSRRLDCDALLRPAHLGVGDR